MKNPIQPVTIIILQKYTEELVQISWTQTCRRLHNLKQPVEELYSQPVLRHWAATPEMVKLWQSGVNLQMVQRNRDSFRKRCLCLMSDSRRSKLPLLVTMCHHDKVFIPESTDKYMNFHFCVRCRYRNGRVGWSVDHLLSGELKFGKNINDLLRCLVWLSFSTTGRFKP